MGGESSTLGAARFPLEMFYTLQKMHFSALINSKSKETIFVWVIIADNYRGDSSYHILVEKGLLLEECALLTKNIFSQDVSRSNEIPWK